MRLTPILLLVLATPALAQEWRPVEVDVSERGANEALALQHEAMEAASRAARRDEKPAESLGEAWKRLERALASVGQPRVEFRDGRLVLESLVSISVVFDSTFVRLAFELEPRVPAPNVLELVAVGGRERWRGKDWEDQRSLSYNLGKLVETMNSAPGDLSGAVRLERGRGGAPDRIVVNLAGAAPLEGVELTGITVRPGLLTLAGRTSRDRLDVSLGAAELNRTLHTVASEPASGGLRNLISHDAWLDVGRDHPGRITLHSTADLPWLPETRYQAVFRLEAAGPQRLRLVLEDVTIGGETMDGFLRSRAGRGLKGWLLRKIYAQLDAQERTVNAAYDRGEGHVRVSHDPARPEVRFIDLRPGFAGAAVVRPGFDIDALTVAPGRIDLAARLSGAPAPSAPTPGLTGALGSLGR